ncbi:uncharacterized protein LOC127748347 [Arachis duranensis]|uniref:Uncharacterized protein LOC127748347 n=1 Tax=Arachis duranensis TaxID=130453 RepID=A0A9C6WK06_ARADU|nr:uncharacterized protein LOC127748347 [Arachis duranensis]
MKPPVSSSPSPRRVIPTPRVRLADPPQSSATASGAPPLKKLKTSEPFNLGAPDFDAIEFVDQQIAPYGGLSMDDVSLLQHLDFITKNSVKMAHMGADERIICIFWLKLRDLSKNLIQRPKRTADAVGF